MRAGKLRTMAWRSGQYPEEIWPTVVAEERKMRALSWRSNIIYTII
jgi:hypothetical protein